MVKDNPGAIQLLREEENRLHLLLSPAKPNDLKALLGRLSLHYSLGTAEANEIKLLIEDYIADLRHLPATAIERACVRYRRDPESRFFPKVGVLIDLARKQCQDEQNQLRSIRQMLELIDKSDSMLTYEPQRPTTSQWDELKRKIAEDMRL